MKHRTNAILKRTGLGWLLTPMLAIAASSSLAAQEATLEIREVPTSTMPDGFSFAAVGDLIYLRPMLETLEASQPEMLRLIREADVAFGNFETMALDLAAFSGAPQAESGGTWMLADPHVVDDVKAMGFDIVSLANNHSSDWGAEGLKETEGRLAAAGLVSAGTGRTLSGARAPRYHDGPQGRTALVAAASTMTSHSRAADPLGEVPGRPGLNPLRVERNALVNAEQFEALASIARTAPQSKVIGTPPDQVRLLGTNYRIGKQIDGKMAFSYELSDGDAQANGFAVRQGRQNSQFAVYSLHNHEPGNDSDVPADFATRIAHQVIDAGADAYVGHGPHIIRGIEIYKGKPIFYSLGNFAMMNNSLDVLPAEMYQRYGMEPGSATVPELLQARGDRSFSDPRQFESVIAISRYTGGKVTEIRLYPIDLGVDEQGASKGVPRLADAVTGLRILERMQQLSKPFGTSITIEKGIGLIRISAND
jgi:poly-gamma-glutamate capsule biosynthesis protein CapA/YwtB (metallophosphatase superfamily)